MARGYDPKTLPSLIPRCSPSPPTDTASTPAFLKWTDAVARGVRYLIAAGEFDAAHELVAHDGKPMSPGQSEDVERAVAWLRYVYKVKENKEARELDG